ncbi:hypothetical protein P3T37_001319 [Kitasatospora sp. MAA4]|uniref:helix-turn-helix domain-containing protein n=1 Tax=Kitasatospora sp. MAA4 TaxID=3035093 RepID=UPI002476C617|nr:helix-turn-helix transcriptional regulator [Kitasatospora sp. MAA4]MDH6131945.1 hypothetical protein [Kitasatospora sp. MAA4]
MSSPSPSAQSARVAVAGRLRDLMLDAGLQGQELAVLCDWHPSKSSRIINAKTPPSDADIRAWCHACDAADQAADLIAANRQAGEMYQEWRKLHRTGLRRVHQAGMPLYERTKLFRVYCSNVIPGLLQTPGYAAALLRMITDFQGTPDDVEAAVRARMARSAVIHDGRHRCVLLIEEQVLHHRIGDAETMAVQLASLLSVMSSPAVALGVIPADTPRTVWPLETFTAFDDGRVHVETLSAALHVTQPSEIGLYLKAFTRLADHAVYGPAARALINKALDAVA